MSFAPPGESISDIRTEQSLLDGTVIAGAAYGEFHPLRLGAALAVPLNSNPRLYNLNAPLNATLSRYTPYVVHPMFPTSFATEKGSPKELGPPPLHLHPLLPWYRWIRGSNQV